MRNLYVSFLAALLASSVPVLTGQEDVEALTLNRALELAEQYSPQLRLAEALNEGAAAAVVTAKAYPNPTFNTLAGPQYRRLASAEPGLLTHFSIDQTIELPSIRRTRLRAAEAGRESTRYTMAESRLNVRAAVKQAFYQVLRRRAEIGLAEENLRLVRDLQRRVQLQVEVGEAARLELTRADAELATAQTFANSARLRHLNAMAALRTAVSAPLAARFEPQGQLEIGVKLPPLDELRQEVLTRHPTLLQAQAEIRRAQARLEAETVQRRQSPSVRMEYERQPDLGFFRMGVSIPIPVLNRREGPIAESVAALNQARAMADLRRLEIQAALERAYGQYELATQQVVSLERGALKEAEAALQAAEAAFRFGERGIIEVLDAQRVLRTVRLDFLSAQYDLQSALIEVEQLRAQEVRP